MTATNDERRKAAAMLRDLAECDWSEANPYWYVMKAAFGDVERHDEAETFNRIADLIEPAPERTCSMDRIGGGMMLCTSCLAIVRMDCVRDCDIVIYASYCPNCGARVVEQ